MHVYEALYCEARPARSQPENATKRFISLIIDIVDPPKLTGWYPAIRPDLEKALSAIQKGAEERLEVLKSKKKQVEQGESSVETVPKLIGHIEKMEADKEIEDKQEGDSGAAVAGMLVVDRRLIKVQILQQQMLVAERQATKV